MKLPTKTRIFGIPFKIKWGKTSTINPAEGGESLWGCDIHASREIRIASDISDRDKIETLFEEIVHAVLIELDRNKLNESHKFITPFVHGIFSALESAGLIKY